jgi:hypothetical protein
MMWFDPATDIPATESRALVVVGSKAPHAHRAVTHPSAAFLTQLLAAKAGLPQTRERRRAEPDEATHSYEVTMSPLPPRTGRTLSRAM